MTKTMFLLRTMLREFEPYLLSFRRSFGLVVRQMCSFGLIYNIVYHELKHTKLL